MGTCQVVKTQCLWKSMELRAPKYISSPFVFSNAREFSAIPGGTKQIPLKLLPVPLLS